MEEVSRHISLTPLASPCFVLRLIGVETEGLLDYQGGRVAFPLYGDFAWSYFGVDLLWGEASWEAS